MGQLSNYNTNLRFAQLAGISGDQTPVPKAKVVARKHLRRLRQPDIAELIDKYLDGTTLKELATNYRINLTTVSAILERTQVRRLGRPLYPNDIEEAIRLYRSGRSLSSVANQFKVSPGTIRHHLSRAGIRPRSRHSK